MFGRSQYKWLLLATVVGTLTCFFPFFSGTRIMDGREEFTNVTSASNLLVATLTISATVGAFMIAHLFTNRRQQLYLTVIAVIISLLNIVFLFVEAGTFNTGNYRWSAVFAFLLPVLLILAAWSTYKDEQMVQSSGEKR